MLTDHFCYEKCQGEVVTKGLLSYDSLNHNCSSWKSAMKANASEAMEKHVIVNPLTKLWKNCGTSGWLQDTILEWFKLAKIAPVQVLGFVEDEGTFSTVTFSKEKLRNCLSDYLEAAVADYSQTWFTSKTLPFYSPYHAWKSDKK